MAVVAGTMLTYDSVGNREDLSNVIYNISPEDTPFLSNAARMKATSTFTEWQTDSLAAAAANQAIQGDDASYTTPAPTVRVGNRCQISRKTLSVSGTQRAVTTAGREDEFEYQLAKRSAEIKRDMEFILTGNQASSAGSLTVAARLGSLEAWYTANTSRGVNGTSGGFSSGNVAAATDSTAGALRTLTEAMLKLCIKNAWNEGGDPRMIMVGATNKQRISTFTGIATLYRDTAGKKMASILGAADIYISDFGEHKIVANRFSRGRTLHALDMDYWGVGYLRPFKTEKLAKTGDADKAMLLVEYTLVSKQESASGVIADLYEGTV